MKNSLVALFSLAAVSFVVFSPTFAHAGALVTKTRDVQVGNFVEGETSVSLQSKYGAVPYPKDKLMWYCTQAEVDTKFKAGQKATSDGNTDAAQILFEHSVAEEPATQKQAREALGSLREARLKAMQPNDGGSSTPAPEPSGPEEKIARGKQIIARGNEMLSKTHLDSTLGSANSSTANQLITQGNALVAEGESELKAIQSKKAAELAVAQAKKQEIQQATKAMEAVQNASEWTQEEKLVNAGVGALFGLIVLGSLWKIVMKAPVEVK